PRLVPAIEHTRVTGSAHAGASHLVNAVTRRIVRSVLPDVAASGRVEHFGHGGRHVLVHGTLVVPPADGDSRRGNSPFVLHAVVDRDAIVFVRQGFAPTGCREGPRPEVVD